MHLVKDILNNEYELLTDQHTLKNTFNSVYATDLLSTAIKHVKNEEALITVIASQTTISLAIMVDVSVIIIIDGQNVPLEVIHRANLENIAMIQTKKLTHEVIIDFYQRGFI
ncbi:hypothetical protein [Mariniplasma anaerobium]|uniref:DRTGG domain-containing protein n=1 Tax=Mariniplasma anaerobium TaxID=2735436 RepID=A0A7U9TIL1_9MOLU|nr:hypothetical protein [Mariniplasma anaerobium]BCR36455.1 hypothetical protein MPAN_013480 [Mariniplasma anaerobium]